MTESAGTRRQLMARAAAAHRKIHGPQVAVDRAYLGRLSVEGLRGYVERSESMVRPSTKPAASASKRPAKATQPTTPKPSSTKPGAKETRPMATKTQKAKAKPDPHAKARKIVKEVLDDPAATKEQKEEILHAFKFVAGEDYERGSETSKKLDMIERDLKDGSPTDEKAREKHRDTLKRIKDSGSATEEEKRRARQLLDKLEEDDKKNADDGASAFTRAHTTIANGVQRFRTPTPRTAVLKRDLAQKNRTAVAFEQARRNAEMTARSVETCREARAVAKAELGAATVLFNAHKDAARALEASAAAHPGVMASATRAREQHAGAQKAFLARCDDFVRANDNLAAAKRSHKEAQNRLAAAREEYEKNR